MRVRYRCVWNQTSAEQQVARGRNVVSRLVPEVRKLEERNMQQKQHDKYHCEHEGWMRTRRSHGCSHSICGTHRVRRDVACNVSLPIVRNAGGRDAIKVLLYDEVGSLLVHRPLRPHARIELDLSKGALVARDVLLQKSQQRLGLLRAQIDPL